MYLHDRQRPVEGEVVVAVESVYNTFQQEGPYLEEHRAKVVIYLLGPLDEEGILAVLVSNSDPNHNCFIYIMRGSRRVSPFFGCLIR